MNTTISEWERMVSGRLYTPADPEIAKRHRAGMIRCDRFNRIALWRTKAKQRALERLIPSAKVCFWMWLLLRRETTSSLAPM